MTNETEKFLEAEQAAEELVEALKKLRDEAVSYQTSTHQLDAVREKLITFIEASQRISQDTKAAVELLKSIGGPEILGSLHQLGGKVVDVGTDLKSTSKSLTDNYLKLDSKIGGVSEDAKATSVNMTRNMLELDSKVAGVGTQVKSTSKSLTDNFTELDSKIGSVSDDVKSSAKMIVENLSDLDANIEAVRAEMQSSTEKITNYLSSEFKASAERIDKLKKLVCGAIGVSALALVASVIVLVKYLSR